MNGDFYSWNNYDCDIYDSAHHEMIYASVTITKE